MLQHWGDLFPRLVSYNRFIELQQRHFIPFAMYLKTHCLGKCSGISFIDSTTLKVCKNQRIHNHKVFNGLAKRGKSSMGWFFGFKLHLVCNEKGELLSFYLTQGNVDDRNPKHIRKLAENLFGKLFGDKGYLSQALWQMLFADGIQLFTKLRKNMKGHIMELKDKILLRNVATSVITFAMFENIKVDFTRGLTEVKIADGNVDFQKYAPEQDMQPLIVEKLKDKPSGKYSVKYEIGNILNYEVIKIEESVLPVLESKKSNNGKKVLKAIGIAALIGFLLFR